MKTASGSGPGAPLPPTLIYIAGLVLGWWLDRAAPLIADEEPDIGVSIVGWGLTAIGTALFAWGMATFATVGTGIMLQRAATEVVAIGPYRWSRNPMYVAFTLMYVGVSMAMGWLWPFLLLPVVIFVLTAAVIAREERYMRATFGPAYAAYCQRVRRWL